MSMSMSMSMLKTLIFTHSKSCRLIQYGVVDEKLRAHQQCPGCKGIYYMYNTEAKLSLRVKTGVWGVGCGVWVIGCGSWPQ